MHHSLKIKSISYSEALIYQSMKLPRTHIKILFQLEPNGVSAKTGSFQIGDQILQVV